MSVVDFTGKIGVKPGTGDYVVTDQITLPDSSQAKSQIFKPAFGLPGDLKAVHEDQPFPSQAYRNAGTASALITRSNTVTAYSANQAYAGATPAVGGSVLVGLSRAAGKAGRLNSLLLLNSNPLCDLMGNIFVFSAPVTELADYAAFTVSLLQMKTLVAQIAFDMNMGIRLPNTTTLQLANLGISYTSASTDLFFLVMTSGIYQPIAAEQFQVTAGFEQFN